MKALQLGVIAMISAGLAAPGSVLAAGDENRIAVQFGDLNIHSTSGAKVLYSRIKLASEQACSVESYVELGSLDRYTETQKCYNDAVDSLVAKIDSAALKRLHNS